MPGEVAAAPEPTFALVQTEGETADQRDCRGRASPVRVIEKVSPEVSVARLSTTLPEPDVITSGPFGGDAIVEFNSAGLASIECP